MEQTKFRLECVYPITCPLCHEKREVSYQSKMAIKYGKVKGYCEICARLQMSLNKIELGKDKSSKFYCHACKKDVLVSKGYEKHYRRFNKGKFICIHCLIKERIALRDKHEKQGIKPYKDTQKKIAKNLQSFSMFGCTLTEQKMKRINGISISSRCKLGTNCKYFLFCLNKVVDYEWKGFTAKGLGHPKDMFS